jgi:hypothetical protein
MLLTTSVRYAMLCHYSHSAYEVPSTLVFAVMLQVVQLLRVTLNAFVPSMPVRDITALHAV